MAEPSGDRCTYSNLASETGRSSQHSRSTTKVLEISSLSCWLMHPGEETTPNHRNWISKVWRRVPQPWFRHEMLLMQHSVIRKLAVLQSCLACRNETFREVGMQRLLHFRHAEVLTNCVVLVNAPQAHASIQTMLGMNSLRQADLLTQN